MRTVAVVPAYDEAPTIGAVVRGVRAACPDVTVVVVDDGSTDGTARAAAAAGADRVLRSSRRGGKAAALRAGFDAALAAGADVVATLDADGQHDPADLSRLLAVADRVPGALILGDRLVAGGDPIPGARLRAIQTADRVLRRLLGVSLRDSQCGLRCYPATLLRRLALREAGFVLETEALVGAARLGHPLVSVPVRAIYPAGRASRFRALGDGARIGWYLTRVVLREAGHRLLHGAAARRVRHPAAVREAS
jgi:glycosyltransferase involved in cell wall biosynthesis